MRPKNFEKHVLKFFDLLPHLDPNQRVKIIQSDENFPLPIILDCFLTNPSNISRSTNQTREVSLSWLITHYFDLNCVPNCLFFIQFSALAYASLKSIDKDAKDDSGQDRSGVTRLKMEAERLMDLGFASSAEMIDDLFDYVYRPSRRLIEVLCDFPATSKQLTLETLLNTLPGPIRPRSYSIASITANSLDLLVSVVSYQTRIRDQRQGLVSNFLALLKTHDIFFGSIHSNYSGKFGFPLANNDNHLQPCIFISAGTGIAPIFCFIRSQIEHLKSNRNQFHLPPYLIIFGCRYSTKDFYFRNDWLDWESKGFVRLICAFSRESNLDSLGRVYVQHQICHYSMMVWQWLRLSNCHVYIVGNEKRMPGEVCDSLHYVVEKESGMNRSDVEQFLTKMDLESRLQIELWN